MNFLYEGRYPDTTIGSTLDKSNQSITIKKSIKNEGKKQNTNLSFTELNGMAVKGCYQMSKQLGRNGEWGKKSHTQASYNPSHDLVEKKSMIGMMSMDRNLSRDKLPPGRPTEYANNVDIKPDYSLSIDPKKVSNARDRLGHVPNSVPAPDFMLQRTKDLGLDPSCGLGYYREKDFMFNVLRDN